MLKNRKTQVIGLALIATIALSGCTTNSNTQKETSSPSSNVKVEASEGEKSLNNLETIFTNSIKKAETDGVVETSESSNGEKTIVLYNPNYSKTRLVAYPASGGPSEASLQDKNSSFIASVTFDAIVTGYNADGASLQGNTSGAFTLSKGKEKVVITTNGEVITGLEFFNNDSSVYKQTIQYGGFTKEQNASLEAIAKSTNTEIQ